MKRLIIILLFISPALYGQGLITLIQQKSAVPLTGTYTPPPTGSAYYVSATGTDANDGLSAATPWQTIAKVNATAFAPGTTIYFKAGETFTGNLELTESGTSGSPIVLTSYGTGQASINGGTGSAIKILNAEWVTVDNLELIGADIGRNTSTAITNTGYGVEVRSTHTEGTRWNGITVTDNTIKGFRVGILITADAQTGTVQPTARGYQNFTVTGNTISNCAMSGINLYAAINFTVPAGIMYSFPDPGNDETVHQNGYIARNNIFDLWGTNISAVADYPNMNQGSALRISCMTGGTIEYNRGDNVGHMGNSFASPAAFELDAGYGVTIQYNEFSNCRLDGIEIDGAGIDIDGNCFNNLIQYNYLWGNDGYGMGGGSVMNGRYQTVPNDGNIYRFNVLVDNGKVNRRDINIWGEGTNYKIYNNTIYSTGNYGAVFEVNANLGGYFANNIIHCTGGRNILTANGLTFPLFLNNLYYTGGDLRLAVNGSTMYNTLSAWQGAGQETLSGTTYGVVGDPLFVSPGTAPQMLPGSDVKLLTLYNVQSGSPAKGVGQAFATQLGSMPATDFTANNIATLNIGAYAN